MHQAFVELPSSTVPLSPVQPYTKPVVGSSTAGTDMGTNGRNLVVPVLTGSICIAKVNVLFSSASLVASSQATAAEIVNSMREHTVCCVLDAVFVNFANRFSKQTASV